MTISYEAVKDFIDYIECWPDEDEPGFDGEHYGGWKKVRDDAPESAKRAFEAYTKEEEKHEKEEEKILLDQILQSMPKDRAKEFTRLLKEEENRKAVVDETA